MFDYPREELSRLEYLIVENEDLFLKEFAPAAETLIGIYFNSECIKFLYLLGDGMTVTDSIKITVFEKFLEKIGLI